MPSLPDPSRLVDYPLTVGQVVPVGIRAVDGGDVWPVDGVYTMVGGPGLGIEGTADLDGDTLTVDWPVEVHTALLSQPYEIRCDGVRFVNGQVQTAGGGPEPSRLAEVTVNLGGPTFEATLVLVGGTGGGGGAPSGPAGGDLAGTYPNPTIGASKVTNTMLAGSIANTKLATDPLARANHTGTQLLSTVSDAGTAAALNVPASGNAASGEVVKGSDSRLSDSRTPAAHASSHASGGGDPLTLAQSQVTNLTSDLAGKLDATSGKIGTTLWSTALTVTSSATLTDIPGLTFSAVNGVKYRIRAVLWVTSTSSTPDIKIGTAGPTGTLRLQCFGVAGSASSLPTGARIDVALTAIAAATTELGIVANTTTAIVVDGYFLASASGTFALQAAQMSSNATSITVEANSSMTYHTA